MRDASRFPITTSALRRAQLAQRVVELSAGEAGGELALHQAELRGVELGLGIGELDDVAEAVLVARLRLAQRGLRSVDLRLRRVHRLARREQRLARLTELVADPVAQRGLARAELGELGLHL